MTSKKELKEQERQEAIAELRKMLSVGQTVYTILRHVSNSGMFRCISLIIIQDGTPKEIDYLAYRALGDKLSEKHGGIEVGGCGMDEGFGLVYNLSSVLFNEGFMCIGSACPSNDHTNGDRDYSYHKHRSGGYALRQRWL